MRNIYVLCVLLKDRRTNIEAVHENVMQVIQPDQQKRNEKTMQDDEGAKHYRNAMQQSKLILSKRTLEIRSTQLRYTNKERSELEQTVLQHLYERKYEDFKNKFTETYKDIDDGNYTILQYATLHSLEDVIR